MKVFLITILLFLCSCHQQQVNDEWIKYGPDQKVDILYYFKKETTNDEVNYFLNNVLSRPRADGRGYSSIEGIQGDFYVRTQNYEGYAIELKKNVTPEEREHILKLINTSPLIHKVFENVIPKDIILDSIKAKKEKEDLEKTKQDNRPTKTIVVTNSSEN